MEEEFVSIDGKNMWTSLYQDIRHESHNFSYTYKDARKMENRNLNRYRDVNPYDHSRVRLQRGGKDYINASLVEVPSANRSYILTQGPLPATTGHFWLMIWEQESKAILMLNRVIEKNAVKCHQYFPIGIVNGGEDEMMLNDVGLAVSFVCEKEAENYTIRTFLIIDFQSGQSRTVLQFHYTTWPDFGVPESPAAFLNFLFAVRDSGALDANVGPAVVHCSAGIGRSGTFCLVDSCLVLIEKEGNTKNIKIRDLLLEMRRYRMGLIQTPDQLRFSYMAIIEGSKKITKNNVDNMVPSTDNDELTNGKRSVTRNSSNSSSSQSDSSDEGIASNTCSSTFSTPPPLPPRPVLNHDISPITSCNSLTDSVPTSKDSLDDQNDSSTILDNDNIILQANVDDVLNKSTEEDVLAVLQNEASTSQSNLDNPESPESPSDLRKRMRIERNEKTAALVQNIKKKQKEAEVQRKRRSILKHLVGLVFLLGTGVFVYKCCSKG